jgi:Zn ribbon nucleic-acid-binding protein
MKHVVVSSGLQEAEIRPPSLMTEFKRLSIGEAQIYFRSPENLTEVACPACDSKTKVEVFQKEGFAYQQCVDCKSVYVSPRPTQEALDHYYRESKASHFRVEELAKGTAEARRVHLLRSHANWMGRMVDEAGNPEARAYTDIDTNLPQVFEEARMLGLFDRLYSLNPFSPLDVECESRGAVVVREPVSGQGAVSAFEKLEHEFSPLGFLKEAASMLVRGGILFFTTRTISGFDLQILWGKAPYIFVPEHLNLLSIDGIHALLERADLELLELSTPGQLDLQLVLHAISGDPTIEIPTFFRYLLNHRDSEAHEDFQSFLQKHRLSSHLRVAAVKRT